MEIVGGFMVMVSILGLFLAVVWLIMPFVVFAIKGKQDRTLEVLEAIEKRLAALEARLQPVEPERNQSGSTGQSAPLTNPSTESSIKNTTDNTVMRPEYAADNNGQEASPAVQGPGGF